MVVLKASAVTGPTPGIVMKRRQSSSFFTTRSNARCSQVLAAAEVDVSGGQVAEALVVAVVVVVVDEGADGGLELAGKEVVLQQDAVLQGLVPARSCPGSAGGSGRPRIWAMPWSPSHLARSPAT